MWRARRKELVDRKRTDGDGSSTVRTPRHQLFEVENAKQVKCHDKDSFLQDKIKDRTGLTKAGTAVSYCPWPQQASLNLLVSLVKICGLRMSSLVRIQCKLVLVPVAPDTTDKTGINAENVRMRCVSWLGKRLFN